MRYLEASHTHTQTQTHTHTQAGRQTHTRSRARTHMLRRGKRAVGICIRVHACLCVCVCVWLSGRATLCLPITSSALSTVSWPELTMLITATRCASDNTISDARGRPLLTTLPDTPLLAGLVGVVGLLRAMAVAPTTA